MNATSFLELINARYSVRSYQNKPVEREKIDVMIEAARLAPSACNAQGWRFVVADDPQVVKELFDKGLGGVVPNSWARTAPVIIAGCYKKDIMTHRVGAAIKGIDYHLIDLGIAGEHLALMAAAQGLGTCWIGWFNQKAVKKIFHLPRLMEVVFLMTLGYPAEDKQNEKKRLPKEEIGFYNRYQD
jgi:nitroreductase